MASDTESTCHSSSSEIESCSSSTVSSPSNPMTSESKKLAYHFFHLAKSMGSSAHDLRLGDYSYYGYGSVPINLIEAVRYYRMASSRGSAEAAYSLAVMYADGELTASGDVPASSAGEGKKRRVKNDKVLKTIQNTCCPK